MATQSTDSEKHAFLQDPNKAVGHAVGDRREENQPIQAEDMRRSQMMARLWDDLEKGVDVGHFGRLLFTMVARHYMNETQVITLLSRNIPVEDAQAMLLLVNSRNYNPPKPNKIRKWQEKQDYKIIPPEKAHDLAWGNVYKELRLPMEIYSQVQDFYKEAVRGIEDGFGPEIKKDK